MKHIFVLLLLIPVLIFGQDCKLKKEVDPFTHVTKISTGFIPFSNGTIRLSIDATPTDIDFFFWINSDGKCFDEASTAVINYEGERSKANFRNAGTMNCEGAFHINFRNVVISPSNLERITTKKISSIVLTGNNKNISNITFTPEQRITLMNMAACVLKESKTLIK